MAGTLLVIDDSSDMVTFVTEIARGVGFDVAVACNARQFRQSYEAREPDVIVLDIVMPEVDGLELLRYLADRHSRSRIFIMSGYSEIYLDHARSLSEMYGLNFVRALKKPVDERDLEAALTGDI